MGLDQYAWAVHPEVLDLATSQDDLTDEQLEQLEEKRSQLMYWRKHADLNAWMENLFQRKHPDRIEQFNCVPLVLDREDVEALREHLDRHDGYLERGQGFFWGETRPEDVEQDREFIKAALAAMDEGLVVYYYCWW